ncbi:phospholipase D-like domain-containing protein [Solicola gregarius]|uniref:Phospholipase D-like domain-containing protein n=1 Tax=Solicola gregarius TaxID=2908642 RepID=A0AA46TMC5_9ACTN|nr:phospholipase D-like domain-containing protein [Solicola gregarius]UYM07900.1 phospholipase D-like domain-containing protein [Solicola gregarius]
MFVTQVAIIISLIGIDNWRKRIRPRKVKFPRTAPAEMPVGDSAATTFTYGEDLYADMLDAIRGAKRRILFESYIWKGDELGREFKDALVEASERGVEVYVVYDGFANLVVPRSFLRFPSAIHVLRYPLFRPGLLMLNVRKSGRDHRKILVVDGETAYVGGYNIGSTYATDWRDTHIKFHGPSAWDFENAFVDFWNMQRADAMPLLADEGARTWEPRIRTHRNVPGLLVFPIRGMYLEAIDRAREHIYITQAYFIPDREILHALLAAARRGVDVRVLVPETSNHVVADWMSRGFYSTLLRGGISIWLYENAMVHAKTATIDGKWTTIGTANIDRLSLTGNYEINVEVFDEGLAAQMEKVFFADSSNARRLPIEEWDRRAIAAKFSESVLAPLRPLL